MNLRRTTGVGMAVSFFLISFTATASNRLEGEWRATSCRQLSNLNQTCDVRSNSKIIFGTDNIQFLISGTLDRRDDGIRYVDVGNRTDVYAGSQKQASHVFENSNRMYIDSPTQRFYFERLSVAHPITSPSASTSSVPYGIWKASHCEYFKDGAPLSAKPCNLKAEMKVSILPEKFVWEIEGKSPKVVSAPGYKEFPKWVEIQNGSSTDRIYTSEKDYIWILTNTPASDVTAKLYFSKIESVSAPAPVATLPSAPTPSTTSAEAGPPEFVGDWVPKSGSCDSKLKFRIEGRQVVLKNGDLSRAFGDLEYCHSCEGGARYSGKIVWLFPEFNSGKEAPFVAYLNAGEKTGVTVLELKDAGLKQQYPLHNVPLKRCKNI